KKKIDENDVRKFFRKCESIAKLKVEQDKLYKERFEAKQESKNIKSDNIANIEKISKAVNKNGSSVLVDCSQCHGKVVVKWNKPRNKYSEKNNLGYYTEKAEDKEK
ncbi:5010_t:CDS:2, partial [Cetraspora pellucida]